MAHVPSRKSINKVSEDFKAINSKKKSPSKLDEK
jgi:hypothetical protein